MGANDVDPDQTPRSVASDLASLFEYLRQVQSIHVISKSKELAETLRDIRTSTYQS